MKRRAIHLIQEDDRWTVRLGQGQEVSGHTLNETLQKLAASLEPDDASQKTFQALNRFNQELDQRHLYTWLWGC